MSRANYILQKLHEFHMDMEHEEYEDDTPAVTPEDTIIHNQKYGDGTYSTPSLNVSPGGFDVQGCSPELLRVHQAGGPYRTTSGNMRSADGRRALDFD
jgi:hypothetical protein